jgi:hypothetical protein
MSAQGNALGVPIDKSYPSPERAAQPFGGEVACTCMIACR